MTVRFLLGRFSFFERGLKDSSDPDPKESYFTNKIRHTGGINMFTIQIGKLILHGQN